MVPKHWNHGCLHFWGVLRITRLWRFCGNLQREDLAPSNPQKLREMQDLWWAQAAKYNVLPMDWRVQERFSSELAGRPELGGTQRQSHFTPVRSGFRPTLRRAC
jgi:hypothetical protein